MVTAIEQTAYFLSLWFLAKTLFGPHGLLPTTFHMHKEGASALYTSLRKLLYLYISWLLLWRILSHAASFHDGCFKQDFHAEI